MEDVIGPHSFAEEAAAPGPSSAVIDSQLQFGKNPVIDWAMHSGPWLCDRMDFSFYSGKVRATPHGIFWWNNKEK